LLPWGICAELPSTVDSTSIRPATATLGALRTPFASLVNYMPAGKGWRVTLLMPASGITKSLNIPASIDFISSETPCSLKSA
jgi:hypothetical protein